MIDFIDVLKQYGPVGLLLAINAVFIVRDWKTIERLEKRVETLETGYRDAVTGVLQQATLALSDNHKIMERLLLNN